MDSIFLKNKKYIKASVIAKELGYTSDYIGQLCRGGKVEAELVGRTWYVADEAIREHKKNRYRSTVKTTKRSLEKMVLAEPQRKLEAFGYKVRVNYEADQAALIPQPKKKVSREVVDEEDQLQVVSDDKVHEVRLKDLTREPKTGSLRINIATEEPLIEPKPVETVTTAKPIPAAATPSKESTPVPAVSSKKLSKEAVRFTPTSVSIARAPSQRLRVGTTTLMLGSTVAAALIALSMNVFSSQTNYDLNTGGENIYIFDTTNISFLYNTLINKIISF